MPDDPRRDARVVRLDVCAHETDRQVGPVRDGDERDPVEVEPRRPVRPRDRVLLEMEVRRVVGERRVDHRDVRGQVLRGEERTEDDPGRGREVAHATEAVPPHPREGRPVGHARRDREAPRGRRPGRVAATRDVEEDVRLATIACPGDRGVEEGAPVAAAPAPRRDREVVDPRREGSDDDAVLDGDERPGRVPRHVLQVALHVGAADPLPRALAQTRVPDRLDRRDVRSARMPHATLDHGVPPSAPGPCPTCR